MADYIIGLKEYGDRIVETDRALRKDLAPTDRDLPFLDFREHSFPGVEAIDRHTLRIRVKGNFSKTPFKVVHYPEGDNWKWIDAEPVLMLRRVQPVARDLVPNESG